MRFYKRGQHLGQRFTGDGKGNKNIFTHAFRQWLKHGKTAARSAAAGILLRILLTLFCLLGIYHTIFRNYPHAGSGGSCNLLALGFSRILSLAGLDTALSPLCQRPFEIDLGCQLIGTMQGVTVDQSYCCARSCLERLSVHAQVQVLSVHRYKYFALCLCQGTSCSAGRSLLSTSSWPLGLSGTVGFKNHTGFPANRSFEKPAPLVCRNCLFG